MSWELDSCHHHILIIRRAVSAQRARESPSSEEMPIPGGRTDVALRQEHHIPARPHPHPSDAAKTPRHDGVARDIPESASSLPMSYIISQIHTIQRNLAHYSSALRQTRPDMTPSLTQCVHVTHCCCSTIGVVLTPLYCVSHQTWCVFSC